MALFGSLFRKKKSDPSSWDELWTVLAPYGGRVTSSSTETWLRAAATMDPKVLAKAKDQLERAYDLLDTEAVARFAGEIPFTGPDRPFARRRFLRTVDAVIVAGPEAVARVAADPSYLRSYDSSPAVAPYETPDPEGYLSDRWDVERWKDPLHRMVWKDVLVSLSTRRQKAWPSVADDSAAQMFHLDPEYGWIDVDASSIAAEQGAPVEARDGWTGAGIEASKRLYAALGSPLERPDVLGLVAVVVLSQAEWDGEAEDGDEVRAGVLNIGIDRSATELDIALSDEECAVTDQDERVALLVGRAAHALLVFDLPFTGSQAAVLGELARSREGQGR
ncbi:hypothetical protein [Oerskovia enterophila]|uniref:Uncharacterized protein n=1 Tax=Oerskovia enterophila TaxID=43678 RepID=A0A163RPF9_9CELL|nr:hypothetical protein [Oerskovia enterophila]KZM35559.1 hypothetical protein OJAG_18240 [Oerskovia enterophila]